MSTSDRALLAALAAETADVRASLNGVAELVSALIRGLPEAERQAALTPAQALDLAAQRLDALAAMLEGLSAGREPAGLIAAITLSDMAARLGAGPAAPAAASGDVVLFE